MKYLFHITLLFTLFNNKVLAQGKTEYQNKQYEKIVKVADSAFAAKDFLRAIRSYEEAHAYKTKEEYPVHKILECEHLIRKDLLTKIKGSWVATEYINAIEKSKSPLKSTENLAGFVTIVIDSKVQGDSIRVGASWNNHEAYGFTAYLQKGLQTKNLKTNLPHYKQKSNFYELGYEIAGTEVFLFLYEYAIDNTLLGKKQFSKVLESQTDNDVAYGLEYMVNQKLFSGNYVIIDDEGKSSELTLSGDGNATGYPEFRTFYVHTDLLGEAAKFDIISFETNYYFTLDLAFEIKEDGIYLYRIDGNEAEGVPLEKGKLRYKLVKK